MRVSSRIVRLGACLAVLACVLFAVRPALAQTQATTGGIEGTVTDPSGGVIAGAQVTVTNTGTGYERRVTTDSNGYYSAVLLPLGTYTVTVETSGFAKTLVKDVQVTMGASTPVAVQLKIAAAGTEISVTAAAPLIETTKTETSAGLGELSIQGLPSTSRNYLDYLVLTPNVHITQGPDGPEIDVNGQKGTETSFMVDGAEANSQFFGEQRGGQRPVANVSMEAVKEFQVVAEGAAAEFGHYTGAFINVVTKSGTNQVHGSLFHLQELGGLTAQLADGTSQNNFTREDFGGSIGGPIKKDKLFYFGNFEGVFTRFKKDNSLLHCCTATDPSTGIASFSSAGQAVNLGQFMLNNFGSQEAGPIPHTNDLQSVLGKVDWVPNSNHTVTIRDYFARSIQENGTFDVPTFGLSANGLEKDYNNALITSWTWALSPTLLNEFRFQFARENRPRQENSFVLPDTTIGPCTQRLDLEPPITSGCLGRNFRFGQPFFHPSFVIDKQFQITDNFSIVHGQHTIKFGFDTLNNVENNFFQGFARGYWEFDTVEGFLNYVNLGPTYVECADGTSGTATVGNATCLSNPGAIVGPLLLFLQFAPAPGLTLAQASTNNFNQFESGLFVQDKWQARPGLTIMFGLRWDNYNQRGPALPPSQTRIGQFLSNPNFPSDGLVPSYHKAVQPRLGIAWDPRNNGKTVFRLNAGVFFGGLPAIIVANGTANNGSIASTAFAASFLNGFTGDTFALTPTYPQCITGTFTPPVCPPPTSPFFDPQVVLFGKGFVYPRTYEGSIGLEQELIKNWKVSASFNYALATHQNRTELFNEPPFSGFGPDGRPLYQGNGGLGPFSGPGGDGTGIATFSNVIRSDGRSLYRGFTVRVDHPFSRSFLLSGYYTYSQTYDDGTSERDQFTNPFSDPRNFAPERGPSPQDQRHNFGLYSVWNLPWHVTWSNTMYAHSARPTSLLCNFDANFDSSAAGDRVFTDGKGNYSCGPGGAGRQIEVNGRLVTLVGSLVNGHDTGRGSFRFSDPGYEWDMRIQRDWIFADRYKLEPSVEIFNLTDNNNFLFPACSELQSCLQGTILQIPGPSRRAQLGLRFEW
jgi:Carboxypeptidase regulatory-like domain/TonB dependent receptor-like, beta-barrel/TonB-dependent Receptor Plug Domain